MARFKVALLVPDGVAHVETSPIQADTAEEAAALIASQHGFASVEVQSDPESPLTTWRANPEGLDGSRPATVTVVELL